MINDALPAGVIAGSSMISLTSEVAGPIRKYGSRKQTNKTVVSKHERIAVAKVRHWTVYSV